MQYKLFDINIDAWGIHLPIHAYGVLIVTGFLCGLFVAWRRAKAAGIEPGLVTDVGVSAIFAGMLGGKAFYLIENHKDFGWSVFNVFDGGLSALGALYGVVVGAGLFFFFRSGSGRRGKRTRKRKIRFVLTLLLFLGISALAGARVHYVTDDTHFDPSTNQNYDTRLFESFGTGFVFYGGILPAVAVIWIMLKVRKAPVLLLFDIIAPSLIIGLAFGRIGCHMTGCCFGKECKPDNALHAVAVRFPRYMDGKPHPEYGEFNFKGDKVPKSPAYMQYGSGSEARPPAPGEVDYSVPVYPTQLFMSASAFGLFWILTWFARKPRRPGSVALLLGSLYPVERFINELFRGDPVFAGGGLRISQWVSIGILAVIVPIAIAFVLRGKRRLRTEDSG